MILGIDLSWKNTISAAKCDQILGLNLRIINLGLSLEAKRQTNWTDKLNITIQHYSRFFTHQIITSAEKNPECQTFQVKDAHLGSWGRTRWNYWHQDNFFFR